MAPPRGPVPGGNVTAAAGADRCAGLPTGGRPPCAEGAKAEWPHHAAVYLRPHRARPPGNLHVIRLPLPGYPLAPRGRAIGARRAPRAFKDVRKVLTGRRRGTQGGHRGITRGTRHAGPGTAALGSPLKHPLQHLSSSCR